MIGPVIMAILTGIMAGLAILAARRDDDDFTAI